MAIDVLKAERYYLATIHAKMADGTAGVRVLNRFDMSMPSNDSAWRRLIS